MDYSAVTRCRRNTIPNAGKATITGSDPLDLKVIDQTCSRGDPKPYGGRYPSGSLVHNGVWYYGTYCLADSDGNFPSQGMNWDILGPFVGFRYSKDLGNRGTTRRTLPRNRCSPIRRSSAGR